jgi:integrase
MPRYKLWQHPDNDRFYVTWTVGGRSHRATTGTAKRDQAQKFLATFILEHDRPPEAQPAKLAVATVLDLYWKRHASKLPSREAIEYRIKHLNKFFGLGAVDTVNARSLERYKIHCVEQGLSVGTINLHRTVLRAALRQAVKFGDLSHAPFIGAEREPPAKANYLTRKQVAAMLRACRKPSRRHMATFILLGVYTGARKGAILDLTWDRVDLKEGTVDFRVPGVIYSRKKRAMTALPARLISHLRRLRKRSKGTHAIMFDGEPVKNVKTAFRAIAKAAGVKATPHTLKHTAVTLALRVASPWIVSGMTATSMRTLSTVYGKHMMPDLKAAAEAVARNGRANQPTEHDRTKVRPSKGNAVE